jgi:hypothetical protein
MRVGRMVFSIVVAGAVGIGAAVFAAGAGKEVAATQFAGAKVEPLKTLVGAKYLDVFGKVVVVGGEKGMVFVFLQTECPISNKLVPELNRLAGVSKEKGVGFYGVISDESVTREAAVKHSKEYAIEFPVLFDGSGELARAMLPKVTPEAFLVSGEGKVLYRGRVNDRFVAVGKERAVVKGHDLKDAIVAVAEGKAVTVKETVAVGCEFEAWKRLADGGKVTWNRDIAPVVYGNCVSCHREGEVAPFPLVTYKDASKRAGMLAQVTGEKLMPPWKAADDWGKFHDERRLTEAQIALFKAWAKAGAPEGDKADAVAAPTFPEGWQLGKPDLVVKMPKAYEVPAKGRDIMAYNVMALDVPEDKYVVGFEYRPGNRKVVHHMIALLDSRGNARKVAKEKGDGTSYVSFGGPGFMPTGGLGGWAPGVTPRFLPEGVGRPLKKGSDLILQVHYHPSGKAESDQGEIALYFATKKVEKVAINFPLSNRQINIAAGDANYVRTKELRVPVDVTLFSITPHMHNIGREMKVTATYADGRVEQLIHVNDWDWNWQDQYSLAVPRKLPRGTKVEMWARFDNSKENPRNPQDPPGRVTFGEQTSNEMCIAFLGVTVDGWMAPMLGEEGDGEKVRQGLRERLRNSKFE